MILRVLCVALCLFLGPSWAEAQISFVNAADLGDNGGASTTLTAAYTATAGSSRLRICLLGDSTAGVDDILSVTYNGVAASLDLKDTSGQHGGGGGDNRFKYNYVVYNPASGSHNVVVTANSSHYLLGGVAEYKGTAVFGPDATATNLAAVGGSPTSVTTSLTTKAVNAWVGGFAEAVDTGAVDPPAAGAGATRRTFGAAFNDWAIFDSNSAVNPPASYSMTSTLPSAAQIDFILDTVSFAPLTPGGLLTMGCCN